MNFDAYDAVVFRIRLISILTTLRGHPHNIPWNLRSPNIKVEFNVAVNIVATGFWSPTDATRTDFAFRWEVCFIVPSSLKDRTKSVSVVIKYCSGMNVWNVPQLRIPFVMHGE
jgi:hypothetical protein